MSYTQPQDQSPGHGLADRVPRYTREASPEGGGGLEGAPAGPLHARVATPAERQRLWPRVTADHKNYAGYQTRTTREIPLVLLEPLV